jgi:hypothetical protein
LATRSFTDANGATWDVWETKPDYPLLVDREFAGGWLTFASGDERRRLAPIPDNWTSADTERLERMCRTATPSLRRRR